MAEEIRQLLLAEEKLKEQLNRAKDRIAIITMMKDITDIPEIETIPKGLKISMRVMKSINDHEKTVIEDALKEIKEELAKFK